MKKLFLLLLLSLGFVGSAYAGEAAEDKTNAIGLFQSVIGTYEGEMTWDSGSSPMTTTIFQEGNSLEGYGEYPDGFRVPIFLIQHDQKNRSLMFQWKGKQTGYASFWFSPTYESFDGTWGRLESYDDGGRWTGQSKAKVESVIDTEAEPKAVDNDLYQILIQSVIGIYEGKVTWDGGESPVTTTIFKQGDSVGGTTTYPDGVQYPITFTKALPDKRGLLLGWIENDSSGQALLLFSPDYSSFEGTWGYDQDFEGDGLWTGRVKDDIKTEEQAEKTITVTESASISRAPYYYFNPDFSVTEDGYGYSIPVGQLANSQEICSVLQHSVFQKALEAQAQFEQEFYFLEKEPLLEVLKKTIETEWKFPSILFEHYTGETTGEQLRQWMLKSFEGKYGPTDIDRGSGGPNLMRILEVNESNMRGWKRSAEGPPPDSIFLENAWEGCLRTIQQTDPALFRLLFQYSVFSGWISTHCLEAKGKMETVFQEDGTITEKMVYEPSERGCAHPGYGGIIHGENGLLFLLVSHREGHKWLLPMLSHFQKNLEQQIIALGGKLEEEKKQQEEAQAQAKAQAEEADKPENQLASGYISYLRTKECYEARQGYAMVFINDQEMETAKRQIKSIEDAISSQHEVDLDMIWERSVNNMSPLGGLEEFAGGLKEYLAMEAQNDFQEVQSFCQLLKMPLTHLENKWVSGASGSGEVKKDF